MHGSHEHLMTLFASAIEFASPAERDAFLAESCGANADLRVRLEDLIRAHERAGGFLEPNPPSDSQPLGSRVGEALESSPSGEEAPGVMIGPYKLIEKIGEGGMGTVWMAQQTERVKRLVAVKLIKRGMDSRHVIARFDAERQALALMDHPNIAKVLDAGTTEEARRSEFGEPTEDRSASDASSAAGPSRLGQGRPGRPYFVMELVKGTPITTYCDEHRLTPRRRLELFVSVCSAIQHAHQKGVIHRDLKPSNILVAAHDGEPVAKVIDFGVAKATGEPLTERTLVTGFGAIIGTLEYMSPEQAELNNRDIDTRGDIYSLGVLLYEMLTGSTPFSKRDLEKAGVLEMLRVIREEEPARPSAKLSTAERLATRAARCDTAPAKLTKLVRGELDWIVMKALEKNRDRRYESASALGADLRRFLNDEPVQACPPSLAYRLRKLWRRHKAALGIAAACAAVTLTATVLLAASNVLIRREREKTSAALADSTRANERLDRSLQAERANFYRYTLDLARRDWLADDIDQARRKLEDCSTDLRDGDWRRLRQACYAEALKIDQGAGPLRFSPNGRWLAGVATGAIVWDARDGSVIHDLRPAQFGGKVGALAFSSDGAELACATTGESTTWLTTVGSEIMPPGFEVSVWDTTTWARISRFERGAELGLARFDHDGGRVALFAAKQSAYFVAKKSAYRPSSTTIVLDSAILFETKSHREIGAFDFPSDRALAFAAILPDGRPLTISQGDDHALLWEPPKRRPSGELALGTTAPRSISLSADGASLALESAAGDAIRVFDLAGSRAPRDIRPFSSRVSSMALSHDGSRLAVGVEDHSIVVWDVELDREVITLRGHRRPVAELAFRPDGGALASSGPDRTTRVWNLPPSSRPSEGAEGEENDR